MDKLLYLLPVLACPVGMSAMMWYMMRSGRKVPATDGHATDLPAKEAELAGLRAEVDRLRAARGDQATGHAEGDDHGPWR